MQVQDVVMRRAEVSDVPGLISLLRELFSIEEDFSFDADLQGKGLRLMVDGGDDRVVLVAEYKKEIIGMCTMQILISTAEGGPVGLIEDMVVTEEYREGGVGARILSAMQGIAVQKGLLRLQLLADTENAPALRFYEKMGWTMTQLICLRKKDFR